MRPIKFRVWDEKHKRMKLPSLNLYIDSMFGTAFWQFGYNQSDPIADSKVMQFTGLKDKGGNEIFEGDIVLWKDQKDNGYKATSIRSTCEVKFDNGNYRIGEREDAWWHDLRELHEQVEIIGNIYENPNLLK